MNKIYITFLLLLIGCNLSLAQKIRYTDTTNVWTVTFDVWDDAPEPSHSYIHYYYGDTVINGQTYYRQDDHFWVREDTLTGKVFYSDSLNNGEKLLFDYNMSIGDTLLSYSYRNSWMYGFIPDTFILTSVDSILINNVFHKVQHFGIIFNGGLFSNATSVIEGIGCIEEARMLIPGHVNPAILLTCFENQNVHPTIYPPFSFFDNINSCNILAVSSHQKEMVKPTVIPNPASDNSIIDLGQKLSSGRLVITNSVGRVIVDRTITEETQVPLSGFLPSIYFYRITNFVTKKVYTGKFIFE